MKALLTESLAPDKKCDTFENLWMWDLSLSCDSENSLENCNCTFAEEFLALGLLDCDDAAICPEDCPICATCMTVIGCTSPPAAQAGEPLPTSTILYIIGAAVLFLIVALAVYHSRRRNQQENELKKNLMAGEDTRGDFYSANSNAELWEPPTAAPIQFDPSNVAASAAMAAAMVKPTKQESDTESDGSGESVAATLLTMDESTVHMVDTGTAPTIHTREETSESDEDASEPEGRVHETIEEVTETEEEVSEPEEGASDPDEETSEPEEGASETDEETSEPDEETPEAEEEGASEPDEETSEPDVETSEPAKEVPEPSVEEAELEDEASDLTENAGRCNDSPLG